MRNVRLFLRLAVTLASVGHAAPADLLLLAADDAMLRPVLRSLANTQIETHAAWTLWRGEMHGKAIVLARTEGDPLNAVAATTLALRVHQPRLVVVYGIARAHDPALQAGDMIISERFAAFDGMISPGRALESGTNPLAWKKLPHLLMTAGEKEAASESFPASPAALQVARTLEMPRGRVVAGVLGSAHQINREADRIAWLRERWNTSTEDGESAHVAGCAALFGVPVIGFRVVDGRGDEAADFTLRFVKAWK